MDRISDEKLIAEYLVGDARALEELIKRYLPMMYGFARQYTGDQDKAADIAQETFIKMWRNIRTFDREKSFKPWIFTIAKNTALDWLRKREDMPISSFEIAGRGNPIENIVDPLPLPSAILDRKIQGKRIDRALHEIPERYHSVVSMHAKDGLKFQEIAKKLRKPINTVKSQYRRALRLLKKHLE